MLNFFHFSYKYLDISSIIIWELRTIWDLGNFNFFFGKRVPTAKVQHLPTAFLDDRDCPRLPCKRLGRRKSGSASFIAAGGQQIEPRGKPARLEPSIPFIFRLNGLYWRNCSGGETIPAKGIVPAFPFYTFRYWIKTIHITSGCVFFIHTLVCISCFNAT